MRTREMLALAKREGKDAGKGAAGWATDGNTSVETYAAILKGIEDGDPAILDRFSPPNLSGEWIDSPTPHSLAYLCDLADDDPRFDWLLDELCSVWEEAASSAFWAEIERVCRYQLR